MIAVFDTNVWVSALKFGGRPREALLRAAIRRELATSDAIQAEIVRTLCEKFRYTPGEVRRAVAPLIRRAYTIQITGSVQNACRDPNDNHLIECAQKAGATLIVSGDKDLLSLQSIQSIRILTPREYLDPALFCQK